MTEPAAGWKQLPNGTRVKNRHEGYSGWILGLHRPSLIDPKRVNPDGKTQYRIYVHGQSVRKLVPEKELDAFSEADVRMVFLDPTKLFQKEIEDRDIPPYRYTIYSLGYYHPQYGKKKQLIIDRGEHTQSILAVKKGSSSYMTSWLEEKIDYFYKKLDPLLGHGFPISTVPSCDPDTLYDGLSYLARKLTNNDRVDATSCLVRHTMIVPPEEAWRYKEDRNDINRHLNSISVKNEALIHSHVLLLIDDITTTGTSLLACRNLLLDKGASEVICLALGETKRL